MAGTLWVPSTQHTREEVAAFFSDKSSPICQQMTQVTDLVFQQAINCCGLTSVAYALSAIGCPTTVDDIFLTVAVNVESAVGDGMTLAEIHDASSRYVARKNLPVFVECYHFDSFSVKPNDFKKACESDGDAGVDDIVILNFHSGIAHGRKKGGGHFSVLLGPKPQSEDIIVADVHGIKYGEVWSTPRDQMFAAMADKDSCGRARGAIRFGRVDRNIARPLNGLSPSLVDWTAPPSPFKSSQFQKYIPKQWDANLGVKNMEGASALSSALRVLEGDESPLGHLDQIMCALKESYTSHLNTFLDAAKIISMVNKLHEKELTKAVAFVQKIEPCTASGLMDALHDVKCGADDVVVLVSYDVNVAHGNELIKKETGEAGALTHGVKSWSLIAQYEHGAAHDKSNGLFIVPAHNVILAGRVWGCSFERMAAGIKALGGGECSIVVLDSRDV